MSIITVYVLMRLSPNDPIILSPPKGPSKRPEAILRAWSLARVRELSAAPVCSGTHSRYSGVVGANAYGDLKNSARGTG